MGVASSDPARARNILQHGIGKWAAECNFDELQGSTAQRAQGMKDRLISMGSGENIGFSQTD